MKTQELSKSNSREEIIIQYQQELYRTCQIGPIGYDTAEFKIANLLRIANKTTAERISQ